MKPNEEDYDLRRRVRRAGLVVKVRWQARIGYSAGVDLVIPNSVCSRFGPLRKRVIGAVESPFLILVVAIWLPIGWYAMDTVDTIERFSRNLSTIWTIYHAIDAVDAW